MQTTPSHKANWLTRLPILALFVSCLSGTTSAIAQTTPVTVADSARVYEKAEQMPEFPGGEMELKKFVGRNLRYTAPALRKRIEGEVYVKFIIDETGRVINPAVQKGIGYGCDEEAIRVIKTLPQFTPGKQNGKPVAVYYTVPVKFAIKYN